MGSADASPEMASVDATPAVPAAPPPDAAPRFGAACGNARLLEAPADPAARGPWPVGVRTEEIAGLTVEIFYPARGEGTPSAYPLGDFLPARERAKVDGVTM